MEINVRNKRKASTNINKLFNGRRDAAKFVDDYGSLILEAKRKAAEEEPETELSKETKHKKNMNEQIFKEKFMNEIKSE